MKYGYARVSTDRQCLTPQLERLQTSGCARIFHEAVSGAIDARSQLRCLISKLTAGDVVVVTNLDRLARSTRGLLNITEEIRSRGATLQSLGEAWADFSSPHGKLMLAVLAGLAEFERSLIISRTREGRHRAQADGVRFGRKPKLTPHQRKEAIARRLGGESLKSISNSYNVSHSTISRLAPMKD